MTKLWPAIWPITVGNLTSDSYINFVLAMNIAGHGCRKKKYKYSTQMCIYIPISETRSRTTLASFWLSCRRPWSTIIANSPSIWPPFSALRPAVFHHAVKTQSAMLSGPPETPKADKENRHGNKKILVMQGIKASMHQWIRKISKQSPFCRVILSNSLLSSLSSLQGKINKIQTKWQSRSCGNSRNTQNKNEGKIQFFWGYK